MDKTNLSRRGFLASAGTVLASLTFSLASGPAAAFAQDEDSAVSLSADGNDGEKNTVDDSKIMIVHTNDIHCGLTNKTTELGYAKLANYVATQRAKYGDARVSLVDSGDNIQGDTSGSLSQGEFPARVIGACKYDVMTCGNHEFDYGMETFFSVRQTEHKAHEGLAYTCCNFLDASGSRIFDAYHLIDYQVAGSNVRVAYVGVCTPSTLTSSTPASFKDKDGNTVYSFCGDASGAKLYEVVQKAVDDARNVGEADYVVLLSHLGQRSTITQWRSDSVVANTRGIDLVLDGHSHEEYVQTAKNADGQDVVIVQGGTKFSAFSSSIIDPATGQATVQLTATGVASELITKWDGTDPEIAELVAQIGEELSKQTSRVIGKSTVDLRVFDEETHGWAIRKQETNMGDLVADAYFYRASNLGRKCDLAFGSGGCIREEIQAGDITYGDCISVLTFNNQLACLKVTGQHILDMLEVGCRKQPEISGGFLQVSEGVTYTVRTDIPTPVVMSDDGSYVERYDGERRVKDACIDGKPIDPNATYDLATIDYILIGGGDAMPIPGNANDAELLGLETDALIEYVQVNLKGVIGEDYANADGAGRIKITDHAEAVDPVDPVEPVDPNEPTNVEPVSPSTTQTTTTTTTQAKKGTGGVPSTGDTSVELGAVAVLGAGAVAAALLAE